MATATQEREQTETRTEKKFKGANHRLFKGKQDGKGSASSWQLNSRPNKKNPDVDDVNLYVELAPQSGENANGDYTFDWKKWDENRQALPSKSLSAKLGLSDIGEILGVLNGGSKAVGKDGKGIYHTPPGTEDSNIIYFSQGDYGYNMKLSHKTKAGDRHEVNHFISFSEGEVLRTLLNSAVLQMTKWVL